VSIAHIEYLVSVRLDERDALCHVCPLSDRQARRFQWARWLAPAFRHGGPPISRHRFRTAREREGHENFVVVFAFDLQRPTLEPVFLESAAL
jgi:hypothetical protein